ncbi:MAG: DUF6273 domain-containing protein [Clostridiaceae bacterium]|nr:DUF6273 domain-containing protein [Clostridiaceae bacterium]
MSQALSNLAVGAKIKFGTLYGSSLVWTLADKNHSGYPTGAVTFVASNIIKLMCADAIESSNSDSNRKSYGNNRWIYSNIRQWMNSAAAAGAWYSAQHSADAAPTNANVWSNYNEYDAIAGFLNGFTANEQAALLSTSLTVGKASVDGGGTETDTCKIFNLSATEVGLTGDFTEGSILSLFNTSSNRVTYPTANAVSNSEYTNSSLNASSAWHWWLRTPYASYSYYVRYVSTDGSLYSNYACNGRYGLRPAFNLSSDLLISDSTDSDGCYTVIYNTAPTTPSSITVPSTVNGGKSLTVSWGASTDADGNLSGYKLERQYGSEGWVQVYAGSSRTYTETITYGKTTVAYRVKAYDAVGAESGYNTSATRTIINNHEPTISGSDRDLGTFSATAPSTTYVVNDEDGDTVAVVVKLDGATFQSFNATLGATVALTFTASQWQQILNGAHTFVITATDPQSAVATRTITFTKSVTTVQFTTDVLAADDMPTKAMFNIQGAFPAGSTLTIEACNNANDASPTWQDVTSRVESGQKVFFSNTTKTADSWGVALRVTLERGTATDPCYITAIGGNFA